jgi:hypothetical protein
MITFGNTSIQISLIAVFLTVWTIWLLLFVASIWFIVQGFRVHWGWGVANLLVPFAIIPFCFLHPKESKKPLILTGSGLGLLLILWVCAGHGGHSPSKVEVSPGLPASSTSAVLHLNLFFPSDASAGNWTQTISGSFSLKMPGIPDIRSQGEEERLIAIRADGFVMRFTKRDGGETQTTFVLFPFGRTTETNTLGWKIIGNFK